MYLFSFTDERVCYAGWTNYTRGQSNDTERIENSGEYNAYVLNLYHSNHTVTDGMHATT